MPAGIKKGLHFGNFEWNNPAQIPFPINTMPSFNGEPGACWWNFIDGKHWNRIRFYVKQWRL